VGTGIGEIPLGTVVRKTQDLITGLNGSLDVFFITSDSVAAAICMGMVIEILNHFLCSSRKDIMMDFSLSDKRKATCQAFLRELKSLVSIS
jgi:hypothetical protein